MFSLGFTVFQLHLTIRVKLQDGAERRVDSRQPPGVAFGRCGDKEKKNLRNRRGKPSLNSPDTLSDHRNENVSLWCSLSLFENYNLTVTSSVSNESDRRKSRLDRSYFFSLSFLPCRADVTPVVTTLASPSLSSGACRLPPTSSWSLPSALTCS